MGAGGETNIPMWLKENGGPAHMKANLIALAFLGLAACFTIGDARKPIAFETIAAPKPGAERTALIILPGFGSDTQDMKKHGVAAAIQEAWPEADVSLADPTFAYYRDGNLID